MMELWNDEVVKVVKIVKVVKVVEIVFTDFTDSNFKTEHLFHPQSRPPRWITRILRIVISHPLA